MPKLQVYTLGHSGVVIDMNPVEPSLPVDSLLNAQNANHDSTGAHGGGLRKRPGLRQFNTITAGGAILGGIPMSVAGTGGAPTPPTAPSIGGPTGDPTGAPPGGVPGPGTPATPGGLPPGGGTGTIFSAPRLFNGARLIVIGRDDNRDGHSQGGNSWYVTDKNFTDQAFLTDATTGFYGGAGIGPITTPAGPPGQSNLAVMGALTGAPAFTVANGVFYYPMGTSATASVTPALPQIRRLTPDGQSDKAILTIPDNPQVLAISPVPSHAVTILSMQVAFGDGNTMYVSVYDNVTSGVSLGKYGRVLQITGLDSGSYTIKEIFNNVLAVYGALSGPGVVPYCLANFLGSIWLGAWTGAAAGGVFAQLRIDLTFSLGWGTTNTTTIADANIGDIGCMQVYLGTLYVGDISHGATAAKVYSYSPINVSAAVQTGGGASNPNGFVSMVVFNGKLYTAYYDTTNGALIYSFDGTTWAVVYTGNTLQTSHPLNLVVDNGVMYAYGCRAPLSLQSLFLWTTDGITFTDATANFPLTGVGYPIGILAGVTQG